MIKLTHVGEILLAEMFNRSPEVKKLIAGKEISNLKPKAPRAISELQLAKCGNLGFDGAHKIDVAVLFPDRNMCLAIEAKLGNDRLGKKPFEDRFLADCETSHKETRVKGSMIAILERKLPAQCENSSVNVKENEGIECQLIPCWVLVVRQSIIDQWAGNNKPALSKNCRIVAFESILEAYGGRDEFNRLVQEMLNFDFYREWVAPAPAICRNR